MTASLPFEERDLRAPLYAVATVNGPYSQPKPWAEMLQWMRQQGYEPAGPTTEVWLDGPATEMRIAVKPGQHP